MLSYDNEVRRSEFISGIHMIVSPGLSTLTELDLKLYIISKSARHVNKVWQEKKSLPMVSIEKFKNF